MSTTIPSVTDVDLAQCAAFAEGLILAHPYLNLVEIAYSWCSPDQVRSLVEALRHVRTHPFRGEEREISMVVSGITFESRCHRGYIYIDDVQFTDQQAEWLESEAIRAAIVAETGDSPMATPIR
jgi:hypothetical protein